MHKSRRLLKSRRGKSFRSCHALDRVGLVPRASGTARCVGSKSEVWRGIAAKTPGGLMRHELMKNKFGKIVSKRKHALGLKRYRSLSKAAKAAWKRNSSKYGK